MITALCVGVLWVLNACEPPDPRDYPLLVTWYNPSLGGLNADDDPTTFADGTPVTLGQYYGTTHFTAVACPPELLGAVMLLPRLDDPGDWYVRCRDTGPAIRVRYNEYHDRVVTHIDVLAHDPIPCNYCLIEGWYIMGYAGG